MIVEKPYLRKITFDKSLVTSFTDYPFNIPALNGFESMEFHQDVTFIIGENGAGKSTLVEAIALSLGFSIEGGTRHVQVRTHNNASILHKYLKLLKSFKVPKEYFFLRAESFYNVATYTEEIDPHKEFGEWLHESSHGEAFMATLTEKMHGNGLYLLDEPEAALSPTRQLATLSVIDRLVKNKSQLIIATHSPILLAYPNAVIYRLDSEGINKVNYEETDHYSVTRYFLNNYKAMIDILIEEG